LNRLACALCCVAALITSWGCEQVPLDFDLGDDIATPIAFTGPAPRWISWSADSEYAAFELGGQLVVATGADMKDAVAITGHSTYGHPSWSPDAKELVYDHPRERFRQATLWIRVALPEEAGEDDTLEPPRELSNVPKRDWMPTWSPRGDWIAFHSTREPVSHVWVMRPSGEDVRFLAPAVSEENSLAWSPSGDELAYVSSIAGKSDIWVVNPDTGATRLITGGEGRHARPRWSPDGDELGYISGAGGGWDVWRASVDGSTEPTQVTSNGDVGLFHWVAGGEAVMYLTGDSEIFARGVDGNEAELVRKAATFSVAPDGARYIHVQAEQNYFRYYAESMPADLMP
jgi:Tol biopolymer transport system component